MPPTTWPDGTAASVDMPNAESCKQECAKQPACSGFDYVPKDGAGKCLWRIGTLLESTMSDAKWIMPHGNFGTGLAAGINHGDRQKSDCYRKQES